MESIQVGKLKQEFSAILQQVQRENKEFVIEYGKRHKQVAILSPYKRATGKRVFGQLAGRATIDANFDDESEVINKMFYSE